MSDELAERDDYSGPFDPDFRYEDLSKEALVKLVREFVLIAHLPDRSIFTAVGMKYGQQAVEELAIAEWMGASPIYTERIRKAFNIEGDDVAAEPEIARLVRGTTAASHEWQPIGAPRPRM